MKRWVAVTWIRRLRHQLAVGIGAAGAVASAQSPAAICRGMVTRVIVAPEEDFFVEFGYGRLRICQIDGSVAVSRGGASGGQATITALRCQALYAGFLSAKYSSQPITVRRWRLPEPLSLSDTLLAMKSCAG